MQIETPIVEDICAARDKARYGAACKRLLSEKRILTWIMKECVQEYCDIPVEEIASKYIESIPEVSTIAVAPGAINISSTRVEDPSINEGAITYDIRFNTAAPASDGLIRLILNIEAQYNFYPGYPLLKRGIYYCSRMISAQYGTEFTEAQYNKIKKVYSIWICMDASKNRQNSITRYCIMEENLVGNVHEKPENYDLLTTIMICLDSEIDIQHEGILKLLNVLLSAETGITDKKRILANEFNIPMSQQLESEALISTVIVPKKTARI